MKEVIRCWNCGTYLMTAVSELPFEIESTGAVIMNMDINMNCPHCHKSGSYTLEPKGVLTHNI